MIRLNKIPVWVIILMVLIGLLYPAIVPYDPNDFSHSPLLSPGREHFLGTNDMGQDIFSGLLSGFRITIGISLTVAFLSTLIGLLAAVASAYYKGLVDTIITKITEIFIIVPDIIVIMLFATFTGPRVGDIIFVMTFFSWSRIARVLRNKTLVAINYETVQYTLLLKGNLIDIVKKMWPYIQPAVVTTFVQQSGRAAVYETTLSFLGVGDPTLKSWGNMIKSAMEYDGLFWDYIYIWWLLPPIVCLVLFVLSLAFIVFKTNGEQDSFTAKI